MKKRSGFVSNSSSSSFLLGFEKLPQSPEELRELLWPSETVLECYDYYVAIDEAAKIVFHDIKQFLESEDIENKDPAVELMSGSFISEYYDLPSWASTPETERMKHDYLCVENEMWSMKWPSESASESERATFRKIRDALWDKGRRMHKELADKIYNMWREKNPKITQVIIVEYSDNDSTTSCVLEHGDVFQAIPHLRISKH